MLFQTPEFLVLFIISIAGIALLRKNTHQHFFMAILSYVFYAWLDVRFLILLLITSLVDYAAALGMDGIQLSWRKRYGLSLFTLVGAVVTLGFNWPMLQGHDYANVPFSWELALQPLTQGDWISPMVQNAKATHAAWLSLGACLIFAALWPIVYELLFRAYDGEKRRKAFLVVSVISNLTVLGFFKYFNFFVDSFAAAAHHLGVEFNRPHLEVLLPMGISFYTFVSMSYTIDAYRKELRAERSFQRFNLFVCYYPHLVAGPIIRPENFLPTLNEPWKFRAQNVISGFHLCLNGFFKKVLIADTIAPLVEQMLGNPVQNNATSMVIMLGAFFFATQIYCDFSGYSDIARGVSRMFGPELPLNFDFPYFATSIIDFWRTWHMSLSTWLRDYLYIPLGGGRGSPPRVYFNLMTTMVLGGLWHGASANFVLWGFYQGALLCINRLFRWSISKLPVAERLLTSYPGNVIRWGITMYFVLLGWLIFRINNPKDPYDFRDLAYCLKKFVFFDFNFSLAALGLGKKAPFLAATWVGVFMVLHAASFFTGRLHDRLDQTPKYLLPFIYATLAAVFFYFWPNSNAAFIYFQF